MRGSDKQTRSDDKQETLLQLQSVSKRFPGVLALDELSFELQSGEVHVLFGENGAGKSTLISLLAGYHQPTTGRILFRGRPVNFHSVHDAFELGISTVFQEFSLVPELNVEENLFLGAEPTRYGVLRHKRIHEKTVNILDDLGFHLKPKQYIADLSRAEQQMLEIAKAFRSDISVLILDEPTASLTEQETNRLFELVEWLKQRGVGIIYITHRMSEIKRIADRITVLRDGCLIKTLAVEDSTEDKLLELMTGRKIAHVFPKINFQPGDTVLKANGLTTRNLAVNELSFNIHSGEIVGFSGLMGSGKSEAARACFGLEGLGGGELIFEDEDITADLTPANMLKKGIFYVTSDRHKEGLILARGARENIIIPSLTLSDFHKGPFVNKQKELETVKRLSTRLNLQPNDLEKALAYFSGGNQQKVMLARTLIRKIKLFIFDEPTVGVDVGTRVAIYRFMAELCEQGAAIILVSSDLPEILYLSHRVYVFHRGLLCKELHDDEITEENILGAFFNEKAA